MKKQYIARHDKAANLLFRSVIKGRQGGSYMIGDFGKIEELKEIGIHSKKIPSFVLPDHIIEVAAPDYGDCAAALTCGDPSRHKMRPDVMVVEMTDKERQQYLPHDARTGEELPELQATLPNGQARKVYIVELGYCNDTRYLEKLQQKETQHLALETALRTHGYKVTTLTYILGYYGSTFKSNLETLKVLGIENAAADKLCRKVHEHSVICAHNIVKSRRFLENSAPTGTRSSHRRKRQRADPP